MTPDQIYDWLLTQGVKEPACIKLGDRHIVGRWEPIGEEIAGYVCASDKQAILVMGWGDTWPNAHEEAKEFLARSIA